MPTKLLKKLIYFIVFIVSLFSFSAVKLSQPSNSYAACWCENGWDDGCQCGRTGTGPYSTNYYGITVYCDSQQEVNTLFSIVNPICGSSVEALPWCSRMIDHTWQWTCWGAEFIDPSSASIPLTIDNQIFEWSGPFRFNDVDFGDAGTTQIFTCFAGNTCCSRHDLSCDMVGVPTTPTSCEPFGATFPPLDLCSGIPSSSEGSSTADCTVTDYPEFHTYRPYPASPCNTSKQDLASFCGNTITLWDDLPPVNYVASAPWEDCTSPDDTDCCDTGDPSDVYTTCRMTEEIARSFAIDIGGAEFPIMGNTEDVAHRGQSEDDDEFTDATKVNEYVSWYLNGVLNNPAEYSRLFAPDDPNDFTNEDDLRRIIDFSGPLKKLTPHRKYRDYVGGSGYSDDDETGQIQEAGITRHDQVVGCRSVTGEIRDCHDIEFIELAPVLRLTDWLRDPGDNIPDWILDLLPDWVERIIQINRRDDLLPPREENYSDFREWYYAYRVWKGDSCILFNIFGIDIGLCIDNPFNPNWIGNLFYHIPFSSTEDRVGEVTVIRSLIQPTAPNIEISNIRVFTDPAELYFPHMEESVKLVRDLQKTFVSRDNIDVRGEVNIAPAETSEYCDLVRVRSNPGDSLHAGELSAQVEYDAEIECEFYDYGNDDGNYCEEYLGGRCVSTSSTTIDCDNDYGEADCPNSLHCCVGVHHPEETDPGNFCLIAGGVCYPGSYACLEDEISSEIGNLCASNFDCYPFGSTCWYANPILTEPVQPACIGETSIQLNLETRTPLADEAWYRTVAGPSSIFQKIFPEIGERGPLESIYDIPGATDVTYSSADRISVGNPSNLRSGTELYFPHIGSIHEYFLQCTQTALRPQGFGEGCTGGESALYSCLPDGVSTDVSFGFNMTNLARWSSGDISEALDYLADECKTTLVRTWVTSNPNRDYNFQAVLDAAPENMRFIVTLENFYRVIIDNPTQWYAEAAQPGSEYYTHVQNMLSQFAHDPRVLVWELANEPQCAGWPEPCFTNMLNWAETISDLIASYGPDAYTSPGLMGGGSMTDGEFRQLSALTNITANSCHYNDRTNNPETCERLAGVAASAGIDYFYVGEAGYEGSGSCSGGGCTNADCTNCCSEAVLLSRVDRIVPDIDRLLLENANINAFLVWHFSLPHHTCDNYSVFPGDPLCESLDCESASSGTGTIEGVISGDCYPGPEPYSSDLDAVIDAAIARGEAAASVPREMLETIYYIESYGEWNNPDYICTPNSVGALGLMQITRTPYTDWVVPDDEQMDDVSQCAAVAGKLSRCNVVDAIELAARVLLVKVGLWDYDYFRPLGTIDSLEQVYCSSAGYYGVTDPDAATDARGAERGAPGHPFDGRTGYADVVCYESGYCPLAEDYPNPRPDARGCLSDPTW